MASVARAARTARRTRLASAGLVVILAAISGFAVWSSHATATAAHDAWSASRLSDDYVAAAEAVAAEESRERKFRLEPSQTVRVSFNQASDQLVAAMGKVVKDGGPADARLSSQVVAAHDEYLGSIARLFDAINRHDLKVVLRIDHNEADPTFTAMEQIVDAAAERHHAASLAQLTHQRQLATFTSRVTPFVFVLGLMLVAALASITRGFQRLRNAERAQAMHDALHDPLTGLPNRRLLDDRLSRALGAAHREGTTVGLLLIDLDRFKEINDTFGHRFGDMLLAQVGPRLVAAIRQVDTVARLGGDEFAILLPTHTDVQTACLVADQIKTALATAFRVDNVDFDVEASIGIVISGEHGHDADLLLQRADIAMYVAKTQNLGDFVYDPVVDGHSAARLAVLGELRRALVRDELVLHYQPKVSISTGDVVGVEALVRWDHPVRGLVQPDEFIPLAEHTGLIGPMMHYVLDCALRQARAWADAGLPLKVAVNLSARNLLDESLPAMIKGLLIVHGVPPATLELEVTESALMTELGRARKLLDQLAKVGVRISIDDFGAGYTSLGQLMDLHVTELKIDRSFVTKMTRDTSMAIIVQSVIELGHNLGLTIVAEGVETAEALDVLADLGCDVAQGYYLSRPMPLQEFDGWLATRPAASLGLDPLGIARMHHLGLGSG